MRTITALFVAATLGAAVEPAGSEPHHRFFAVDDLERQVLAHAHDEHVNGVGADIDGGYAHELRPRPRQACGAFAIYSTGRTWRRASAALKRSSGNGSAH